jgi:hypothetical protein
MLVIAALVNHLHQLMPGINFDNPHCHTGIVVQAVAEAAVTVITRDARVTVPAHAGARYAITGVTQAALSLAISQEMTGFVLTGPHADGDLIPLALSHALADTLNATATVAVPTDAVGEFAVLDVTAATLRQHMITHLSPRINLTEPHGQAMVLFDACATALSDALTDDARAVVNGVSGGTFRIS